MQPTCNTKSEIQHDCNTRGFGVFLLTILHAIDNLPISDELSNPPHGHHAFLCIGELFMISHEVLLVPRILLHHFVIIHILENHLAKTIKVGEVAHLVVEETVHQRPSPICIVYLIALFIRLMHTQATDESTMVHRFTPYLTIRSLVIGADTLVIWCL
jgi:hypothetical protein